MKSISFLFVFVFLLSAPINAQDLHDEWEKYLESDEETENQIYLLEKLEDLIENPIDLNQASLEEVLAIPSFPVESAKAILGKRPFKSLGDAKKTLNIEDDQWLWLRQFLIVVPQKEKPKLYGEVRIRWIRPVEISRGLSEGHFDGSIGKIYQRYRAGRGNSLRFGALLEKDSGERSLKDHFVFSLEKRWGQDGPILVLGDFRVRLGMGLIVSPPFSVRKGANIFSITREKRRAFRPFVSSSESGYFRGIGFQLERDAWRLGGWISNLKVDAGLTEDGKISSFVLTGLHRTDIEKAKIGSASSRTIGGFLGHYFGSSLDLEMAILTSDFSPGISQDQTEPEGWRISGSESSHLGVSFRGKINNLTYFGEAAWNHLKANAFLFGIARHWPTLKILLIRRRYSHKYDNLFAQGFGEQGGTRNEQGWYLATELKPKRYSTISMGFDQFATPWRTFRNDLPQNGSEIFFQWSQRVNRDFRFYFRYSSETKLSGAFIKAQSASYENRLVPFSKNRLRLHFSLKIDKRFEMSGRLENMSYAPFGPKRSLIKRSVNTGWLFFWDLRKTSYTGQFRGGLRFTFFDTESNDVQLYQFEQSLPGMVSNKLMTGRGMRFYTYLQIRLSRHYILSAKYAVIRYADRTSIGSGWDEINSPARHDLSFQIDIRL